MFLIEFFLWLRLYPWNLISIIAAKGSFLLTTHSTPSIPNYESSIYVCM